MPRSAYEEEKVLELDKQLSLLEQSQSVMNKEISEMKGKIYEQQVEDLYSAAKNFSEIGC